MQDLYRQAREAFTWRIPEYFNIGLDICDRWAVREPNRTALIELTASGLKKTTYGELLQYSNRLANFLTTRGIERGDRVAILTSQRAETVIAHIATYKLGAIAVPLFCLFGPDALLHRLNDSTSRIALTDTQGLARLEAIRSQIPHLETIVSFDDETLDLESFPATHTAVETRADDPALIIYTSGTTGASKGALHAHRVLLGHLPGVEMSHSGFPRERDCIWTPADWAWIGGLLDVVFPALHHGVPVVAHRFAKFDAWFPSKPGAIGKAAPGHDVAIVDEEGRALPPGVEGHIAIKAPDVMFLGYWNNPAATAETFRGDWLITGDRGTQDEEGYFHFVGRLDDVITSAGYRIGPAEIEDCLLRHPAVASAGVVGIPDPLRTEIVTAFVVLREGVHQSDTLIAELQNHVRERLGAHQYPRRVIFLNQLPMTITGKILRRELRAHFSAACGAGWHPAADW